MSHSHHSYGDITERPGVESSREGADMLYSRYAHAAAVGRGRRVLEVGCGPGLGLGLMAEHAAAVVGGDLDEGLLAQAKSTYDHEIPLLQLDGQELPFADGSFDVVLFFEGSYYVPDMDRVMDEMARVAAPEGTLLFVNANPERPDFIPSPLSVHYHTAEEFRKGLEARGFKVVVEGAFPLDERGPLARALTLARKVATRLGLIPRTLAGRALLKRLVSGRLIRIPARIGEGFGQPGARQPIAPGATAPGWKVLYVTATR